MLADEAFAWLMRTTGASLETLYLVGYLASLALIWTGVLLIGTRLSANPLVPVALAAAFTLRHRIARTSANTFEPYFHPRMVAFGICLLAVAAFLRGRRWTAVALVGVTALVHVTTALCFSILLGVAMVVVDVRMRRFAIAAVAAAGLFLAWALAAGPLARSLTRMDGVWLQAVASKDSLFVSDWPLWAWLSNLLLLAVVWGAHEYRRRQGTATAEERALAWGATGLVAVFILTVPPVLLHLAFPVQLQISRVFWVVDFVATAFAIAAIGDAGRRATAIVLGLLIATSVVRGAYVMTVEHPERTLFATSLPDNAWEDAMGWIRRQPADVHVLADPGHAWKFGSSVRVSGARDVFLEEVKDSAIAIYSRDVATRVVERIAAIGDFSQLSPEAMRDMAARYDVDLVVTERDLPFPVAYRNTQFRVYRLPRPTSP